MSDQANQFVEYLMIGAILDDLLAAGFSISINDGKETVINRSTDKAAILAVMHSTDEDFLYVHGTPHNPPENFGLYTSFDVDPERYARDCVGCIRLIYGNEGAYVVNDFSGQIGYWLDANDSQYQRWFRYIDDFKWGTPSPLDAKMATMRDLIDVVQGTVDDARNVAKKAEQAARDLWHGLDENNKAWLEMPQGARDAHPDRYISDVIKQNKDVLYEHKAYKPDYELQPEPGEAQAIRDAVRPLVDACVASYLDDDADDTEEVSVPTNGITAGMIRKARQAIEDVRKIKKPKPIAGFGGGGGSSGMAGFGTTAGVGFGGVGFASSPAGIGGVGHHSSFSGPAIAMGGSNSNAETRRKFSIKIPEAGEPFVIEVSSPTKQQLTLGDVTDVLIEAAQMIDRVGGKSTSGSVYTGSVDGASAEKKQTNASLQFGCADAAIPVKTEPSNKLIIDLTPHEIQSKYDRLKFAEGLIKQLPDDHDGRNTWLTNYGTKD